MLQIQHLTITHTRDLRTLVADFSLVLQDTDRVAIIGEEGNGKSTLLKLIALGDLDYAEWTGQIHRGGAKLGYLAQELTGEELAKPAGQWWDPALAGRLGLTLDPAGLQRPMGQLSGGERVKLRLAHLLSQQPDILLLDEPTNDLDLDTLQWLEEFLLTCGLPVMYVSHDETLIRRTANVIVHLEALRRKTVPRATVARMPYDAYVQARQAKFAHQAKVSRSEHEAFRQQMERYRKIRDKVEHQQATISRQDPHGGRLLKKKMHAVQSMGRRFQQEKEKLTQMPEMEEAIFLRFPASATIPQGKTVLDFRLDTLQVGQRVLARDLTLKVTGPERIGIIGPNGCGKTRLLGTMAEVLLVRRDIRAAYMPQDYGLPSDKTPVEFLNRSGSRAEATAIRNYLGSLRFTTLEMERPAGALSGGQKAKLLLLGMVLAEANVLVLDEPTRNLSPLSGPVLRQVLAEFGGAVISVSHDRAYLAEVCRKIYLLTPQGLVLL